MCQNLHIPEKLAKICMSHQMTPFIDFSQNGPIFIDNISSKNFVNYASKFAFCF